MKSLASACCALLLSSAANAVTFGTFVEGSAYYDYDVNDSAFIEVYSNDRGSNHAYTEGYLPAFTETRCEGDVCEDHPVPEASYRAEASISSAFTPILRAASVESAFAIASSLQSYQYIGSEIEPVHQINLNLHGVVSGDSSITLDFYIFDQRNLFDSPGGLDCYPNYTFMAAAEFDAAACGTTESPFSMRYNWDMTSLGINGDGEYSLTETINFFSYPQDNFVIYARLWAEGHVGNADAFHTFTMDFESPENYVSANPVPAPAALWLFISGILTTLGFARSKK